MVSVIVREGQFRQIDEGLTFHVAERAPGGRLKGVLILDGRDEKETLTYLAQDGLVSSVGGKTFLILENGEIQRLNRQSQQISVIKYQSYAYDLSGLSSAQKSHIVSQSEIPTSQLFSPDVDAKLYRSFPERYRAEFHRRFSIGLWPIVVGMVVLVFVGNPNSSRQGQGIAVVSAASLVVVLRTISIVSETAMRKTPSAAIIVWGIPLLTLAICLYFLATDRSPMPKQVQARIALTLDGIRIGIVDFIGKLGKGQRTILKRDVS